MENNEPESEFIGWEILNNSCRRHLEIVQSFITEYKVETITIYLFIINSELIAFLTASSTVGGT